MLSSSRGSDAPPLLLKAARQFEPLDPRLARETYLDALAAATFAGRWLWAAGCARSPRRRGWRRRRRPRGPDLLLDGLSLLICEGYPAGVPVLGPAVSAFRGTDVSAEEGLRWLWLACRAAQIARATQAGTYCPAARSGWPVMLVRFSCSPSLSTCARQRLCSPGSSPKVAAMVAQADSVTEATGSSIAPYGAGGPGCLRRPGSRSRSPAPDRYRRRGAPGEGISAQLHRVGGRGAGQQPGRHAEALAAAQRSSEDSPAAQFADWARVELVEAAVRSAVPERAAVRHSGSPASPAPAGPTGRWVPRPARGRWSATAQPPRTCTARPSTASAAPACAWN